MKRAREEEEGEERAYTSTELVPELRTAFGSLFNVWKEHGWRPKEFRLFLSEAGYPVPEKTLRTWAANVHSGGSAVSSSKESGRPRSISDEKVRHLVGWVLYQNEQNVEVHLKTAMAFVRSSLGIDVSTSTVHTYLHEAGFASKVMQTKKTGYKASVSSLCEVMLDWLLLTNLDVPLHLLCSVDFTFTGHRLERHFTYAPSGGAQPMSDRSRTSYTNCIITCVWADGKNRTPAVLYTLDPKFRRDRKVTASNKDDVAWLDECLRDYGVNPERVVYVGKGKGEKGNYVSESADLLRRFFEYYRVPKGGIVLSDNGTSFLENGEDIFTKLGFVRHLHYPAAVHQYLSPNDNRLHGAAKKMWRNSGVDYSDDVNASLYLLAALDYCSKDVKKYFKRNLQLDRDRPVLDQVEPIIKGTKVAEGRYYRECLREYRLYIGEDARESVPDAPPGLESVLDGATGQ
jgi:transposase